MKLSTLGKIVQAEWLRSAEIRKEIQIFDDEFVVMPNHLHGINWIVDVGADGVRPENERAHTMRPDETSAQPNNGRMPSPPQPKTRTHTVRPYEGRRVLWDHLSQASRRQSHQGLNAN
ncbi:MAG: hypothetical protein ABI904_09165 [Chloroflexota bacterium]